MKTLPVRYLHECFAYDPESGVLRWRERPRHHFKSDKGWRSSHTQTAGKVVASNYAIGPYAYVMVDRTPYLVHRICFVLHHGYWPIEVDHRNGDTRDNRIANLRAATSEQNKWNAQKRTTNQSGLKGIHFSHDCRAKPWQGRLMISGITHRTAYFATKEEAWKAYLVLEENLHGEFAFTRRGNK